MEAIKNFWDKFKTQPDVWFFFGFLFVFTLSIRKVILYFPVQGTFNEYTGIYLYLSDIFIALTLISWVLIILSNIKIEMSNNSLWITCLFPKLSTAVKNFISKSALFLPFLLVTWSMLSTGWSDNQIIAVFRSFKLLEFYLLYVYIVLRLVPLMFHPAESLRARGARVEHLSKAGLSCFTCLAGRHAWNIFGYSMVILGVLQSIVGIFQVILQHSIGLFWLKESLISPNIPGVAKLVIHGEKYIRAYGLFPHPNILGGFLLISIILTLLYIRMFHVEHSGNNSQHVPRGTFLLWAVLAIQLLALVLSFSKSAILALMLALVYVYVPPRKVLLFVKLRGKRGTFNPFRRVPRGTFCKMGIAVALAIFVVVFVIGNDLRANIDQSIVERMTYLNVSRGTISDAPIAGVGQGMFVWNMARNSQNTLEMWQFQPVHNVFLLIWSELGVVGLVLFILFVYNVFYSSSKQPGAEYKEFNNSKDVPLRKKCSTWNILRGTRRTFCEVIMEKESFRYLQAIILGFIFLMFWDHYSWDIQQGQAMLWVVFGFVAGIKGFQYKAKESNLTK